MRVVLENLSSLYQLIELRLAMLKDCLEIRKESNGQSIFVRLNFEENALRVRKQAQISRSPLSVPSCFRATCPPGKKVFPRK